MSDSDADRILRAVLGGRQQKPVSVKFDKDQFLKALNESLVDRFPRLIPAGQSGLFVYRGDLPLDRIARGMAAAGKRPATIVRLRSEDLQRGEGWKLLEPLLHGSTLIVLHEGASSIGANLAGYWPRFADHPKSYVAPITKSLVLDHRLTIESPGAVVVVQRESTNTPSHVTPWPLVEEDATAVAALADSWTGEIATIGRPPGERVMFRNNEEAYRAYRALVRDIEAAVHDRRVAETIAGQAIHGNDALKLEISFHVNQIDLQLYDALYYRLSGLSEHCRPLGGGFREEEALPDVYAAALIISRVWKAAPEHELVYRGQRNSVWPLLPSYFRPPSDGTPPDLDGREKRLRRFAALLARNYPQLSEWQCVAAAQHVSSEARTPTWLIDVTWDPLIALYFASSGAQAGDVGIVDQVVMPEWRSHVAANAELPGGLMAVEVPIIERVRRQRGLFLNAPRADLYERYAPHRLWFRQQAGIVFTDVTADPPISDAWLLPPESHLDELIAALDNPKIRVKAASIVAPPSNPTAPLTGAALLETVKHRDDVTSLDAFHRSVLEVVAELLADPHEWTDARDSSKFSVHRFDEAIGRLAKAQEGVVAGGRAYLKDALKFTKWRVTEDEWSALVGRAHEIWMQRYRIPPSDVVSGVAAFVDELRELAPAVLGAAFPGPEDHRELVLKAVAADQRWRFYDLRLASAENASKVLPQLVKGGIAVVAAAPDLKPDPLRELTEAISDEAAVRLGGKPLQIAGDALVVFVFGEGKPYSALGAPDGIICATNIDGFGGNR